MTDTPSTDEAALIERLRAEVRTQTVRADMAEAERDDLRAAIASPEAVHANMLRGGIPRLSIRQALHLHGEDALRRLMSNMEIARRDAFFALHPEEHPLARAAARTALGEA